MDDVPVRELLGMVARQHLGKVAAAARSCGFTFEEFAAAGGTREQWDAPCGRPGVRVLRHFARISLPPTSPDNVFEAYRYGGPATFQYAP